MAVLAAQLEGRRITCLHTVLRPCDFEQRQQRQGIQRNSMCTGLRWRFIQNGRRVAVWLLLGCLLAWLAASCVAAILSSFLCSPQFSCDYNSSAYLSEQPALLGGAKLCVPPVGWFFPARRSCRPIRAPRSVRLPPFAWKGMACLLTICVVASVAVLSLCAAFPHGGFIATSGALLPATVLTMGNSNVAD